MKISAKWKLTIVIGLGVGFSITEIQAQTVVPFALKAGHLIVVEGSIGPLESLNLVIDTGASATVVSSSLAKKLRLKGNTKKVVAFDKTIVVKEVTLPVITIGALQFQDASAQVSSLTLSQMAEYSPIDALIGLELLRKTGLVIDYEDRTLTLGPVVHSGSPVAFYNKFPFVPVALLVRGRTVNLLLDTGFSDLVLFARSIEGRIAFRRTGEMTDIRSASGRKSLEKVLLAEVRLGETEWRELPAYLLEAAAPMSRLDGVLGVASLRLKRLCLDFENGLMSHHCCWPP
jgi:predicted aspartyl protease